MKIFYKGHPITSIGGRKELKSIANTRYKIAQYKFNSSIDTLFSEVNDGFVYIHTDIDNGDGTITRTIYSDQLPTIIRFEDCEGLLELLYLNTSELTTLRKSFKNCYNITSINAANWDTSKVTSLYEAFEDCNNLTTLDVSNWDTYNVTDMLGIFDNCHSLTTLDISNWDTSNVTATANMFDNCTNLISITMNNSDYNSVNKIIEQLPTRTSDSTGALYIEGVDNHKLVNKSEAGLRHWAIMTVFPNIKYYTLANEAEGAFTYPIINSDESVLSNSSIYVKPIENEGSDETVLCIEIEIQEDINSIQFVNPEYLLKMLILDTSNMTTMKDLFKNCTQLNSIECSDFDTSKVTDMSYMFTNCQNLNSLDVSNFDTSKVKDMSYMFCDCESLETLKLNNWYINDKASIDKMFSSDEYTGCPNLNNIEMQNSDYNSVNKIISELPTRTAENLGVLDITGVDDISKIDVATAEAKYWNIINEENTYND